MITLSIQHSIPSHPIHPSASAHLRKKKVLFCHDDVLGRATCTLIFMLGHQYTEGIASPISKFKNPRRRRVTRATRGWMERTVAWGLHSLKQSWKWKVGPWKDPFSSTRGSWPASMITVIYFRRTRQQKKSGSRIRAKHTFSTSGFSATRPWSPDSSGCGVR